MTPLDYTKNRNVRDALDTPDPKDKKLPVQIQNLRPLRTRVGLISIEKSKRYDTMKKSKTSGPPLWGVFAGF